MSGGTEESVGALIAQLVDDGKSYARAEARVQLAGFAPRIADARRAAILGAVALVLANGVLITVLVGLLLVLQARVGIGAATAIVAAVGLAIAAILVWLAVGRAKAAMAPRSKES